MRREPKSVHDTMLLERTLGVRNDTRAAAIARLEAADRRLDQEQNVRGRVEASAANTADLVAQGRRWLLAGAAAALVILSAGLSYRIAFGAAGPGRAMPFPVERPSVAAIPPGRDDVVVRDYVLFTSTTRQVAGLDHIVQAGHRFEDETAATFSEAWCYTERDVDGIRIRLQLGDLVPGQPAAPSPFQAETREAMGLSVAQEADLFRACPWLDAGSAARADASTSYRFEGEVTDASVGRLVAAVRGGARDISLRSGGGDLEAALAGFDALHEAGVRMRATGACASACVLLFAAGRERIVEPDGSIAIHRWRTTDGETDEADAQIMSAELLSRFVRAGISPQLHVAASQVPAETVHELTRDELRHWGVVTPDPR